jgi:hypothetical protein
VASSLYAARLGCDRWGSHAFGTAGGSGAVALGLFAGALTFYLGDLAIDRLGGEERKSGSHLLPFGASLLSSPHILSIVKE